jgi:NTP pyrophosphatase (non-canonical NTP hydrolase)
VNIPYEERREVYQTAISLYGKEAQRQMVIEEMSELTKEICKISRGKLDLEALADEIADVTIMLEQLRLMYDIDAEVNSHIDYKVLRLVARLAGKGGSL